MAKRSPKAPARESIPADVLELRQSAVRIYYARQHEANVLAQAAWDNPTAESALAALMARKAENAAYVDYNKACGGNGADAVRH